MTGISVIYGAFYINVIQVSFVVQYINSMANVHEELTTTKKINCRVDEAGGLSHAEKTIVTVIGSVMCVFGGFGYVYTIYDVVRFSIFK